MARYHAPGGLPGAFGGSMKEYLLEAVKTVEQGLKAPVELPKQEAHTPIYRGLPKGALKNETVGNERRIPLQ